MDRKLLNDFRRWVQQLEHLKKIKINNAIIESQKRYPNMLKNNSIDDSRKLIQENIKVIKAIIILDLLLVKMNSIEIDAAVYAEINSLACFCEGITVGIFNISYPILSKNYSGLVNELHSVVRSYRNQKGKEWRDKLFKIATDEYNQDPLNNKTTALKRAFEKLSEKELYRKEFDTYFDSIYRKFTSLFN
ncbi:MAG TPA: hypothetical protein PLZ15_09195 [Melioribacteraceae bacterium]|nr:hypothetical protein [Melioribacteraceae bacterium]